ncbi:MAG: sarcosine oxidase subunit gamma [Granulosicoccus sp.]
MTAAVQSALDHVTIYDQEAQAAALKLIAMPVCGLLMLRASSDAEALGKALSTRCGMTLPARLSSNQKVDLCIRWMSPDQWLLSCPLQTVYGVERDLRQSVEGHIAIGNGSGGYSTLHLQGDNARSVLMKSTGYDVDPQHFTAGKVVNTMVAKAQATLRCVSTDHYELLVRRSLADYLWRWLLHAGEEYDMISGRSDTIGLHAD